MKQSILQIIADKLFGHKYYVNIINTRGTDKCEASSFIHSSRAAAEKHRKEIDTTRSFLYIETVSFRSRKVYS